jgi:7,8-dihydroneopterin aldolase/epimerase/oxygenase
MSEILGVIGFDHCKIRCIIGTEMHERKAEQDIYVDLRVEADVSAAIHSDALHDAINYVLLATICKEVAQHGRYYLLEKYADDVLGVIIKRFSVKWAWIRVKKPQAIADAEAAFVELKRYRQ